MRHRSSSADFVPILSVVVGLAVSAYGEPPHEQSGKVPSQSAASLSAAGRLGIKFSPPAQEGESPPGAPRLPGLNPADTLLPVTLLEPFVVSGPRVKLTEKDVLTDKARLELAKKTQLTPLYRVTFGPLAQLGTYYFDWLSILGGWHPNDVEAMILYRQEEDIRRKTEMDSLTRLESLYDAKDEKLLPQLKVEKTNKTRGLHFVIP